MTDKKLGLRCLGDSEGPGIEQLGGEPTFDPKDVTPAYQDCNNQSLDAALAYAARGWYVFPAPAGTKKSHKKAEFSAGAKWGKTRDPEQIRRDFTQWPDANVGLPAGKESGFWVMEADTPVGHGVDGIASLKVLEDEHGPLPLTLMACSPSGSVHYYFNWPEGSSIINSTSKIAPGVDVRGDGGMVIAPPSVRKDGQYRWLNDLPITDAPEWLIDLASGRERKPQPTHEQLSEAAPEWIKAEHMGKGIVDPVDMAELRAALFAVDPNIYDNWFACMAALKTDLKEAGRALALEWTQAGKGDDYQKRRLDRFDVKWDIDLNQKLKSVTEKHLGLIFYLANEAAPGWRDGIELEPDKSARAESSTHDTEDQAKDEAPPTSDLNEWDAGDDIDPIPPRGWLFGNVFCRGFASSLIADGGTGKSALRYAQGLSLATGRQLTGEHVFQRCRVLIVSFEDGRDELRRRVRAAMKYHGISHADVKGWLFLAAAGRDAGKLLTVNSKGGAVVGRLEDNLRAAIQKWHMDLVILDPFVKTHGVEENDNNRMDQVVQILAELATEEDIAVDFPHHTSKGRAATPGDADRGRGATAVKDGARLVYTLTTMSPEEAKMFNIAEGERRLFFRVDSGKVNITPPTKEAAWFKLVGVPLGNSSALYPSGDNVQTVERWTPPETFEGITADLTNRILNEIAGGLPDGNYFTNTINAKEREAWLVVQKHVPHKSKALCRDVIKAWVGSGLLISFPYHNNVTRKDVTGLKVDDAKRPKEREEVM